MRKLTILILMMVMAMAVRAIPYDEARRRAAFLSDKMAYELNLTPMQYEDVYQVNLDFLMMVNSRADMDGYLWEQRNFELQRILSPAQYSLYVNTIYFYRPIYWNGGRWRYGVYRRYTDQRYFYRGRPRAYDRYRGGRYFRGGPGPGTRRAPAPTRGVRRAPAPTRGVRRAPAPRQGFRGGPGPQRRDFRGGPAPQPRQNFRGGNGPQQRPNVRGGQQPPRQNFRGGNQQGTRRYDSGTRRLPPSGRVTPNGMVQRVGGTSRTQVTVRQNNNNNNNVRPQRNGNNNRPNNANRRDQRRR